MRSFFIPSIIGSILLVNISYGQDCRDDPVFATLNFWVGEWEVYSDKRQVGENRVEKILEGCAILEHWQDARGNKGKSLFYYYPAEKRWKQVWVTPNPFQPGGVKEKMHIGTLENGTVQFQGMVITPQGKSYLDRTLLIPLDSMRVRQIIKISQDKGKSWQVVFKALYQEKDTDS